MNITVWCKSFLAIYNLIPAIVKSIDRLVVVRGVNSSAICFGDTTRSTMGEVEAIIDLSQKKINLINLKLLTDETIIEMDKNLSKILIMKFVDGVSVEDTLSSLSLTRRTYFRKVKLALQEFERIFTRKLLANKKIYASFLKEKFLEDVFEKISLFETRTKSDDSISRNQETIFGFIVSRLKKSF